MVEAEMSEDRALEIARGLVDSLETFYPGRLSGMIASALRAAVAAECEACAKIAEQYRDALENWQDTHICGEIAAKIRARSGTDN